MSSAFTPFRDRPEPTKGDRIRVYRNLNRPGMYSILALTGPHKGKVLGYAPAVAISDVAFKVSEKGRQTVLAQQKRHVHAFAEGHYTTSAQQLPDGMSVTDHNTITYRPYLVGHFFRLAKPETPVKHLQSGWAWGAGLVETEKGDAEKIQTDA